MKIPLPSTLVFRLLCLAALNILPATAENQALPPPVTLTFEVAQQISLTEYELKLDMSAENDCHVKISLFLPPGAMVTNPNLYIPRPTKSRNGKPASEFQLFLGPLKQGAAHTFTLPVKLTQALPIQAIAETRSLMAPFGFQEKSLTLGQAGEA